MKFRKKPVIIEAIQFTGKNKWDVMDFFKGNKFEAQFRYEDGKDYPSYIAIQTLEGTMLAQRQDWIIKGVNGEFYSCTPDIFEKTYEAVE